MKTKNQRLDLSVVILNYNTAELTRACLLSLVNAKMGAYTMEIILCDNGSSDGSVAMVKKEFPSVTIVDNKKNLGFAAGNNRGIARALGRYVLLLNTDTEVSQDTLSEMMRLMDRNADAGAGTCLLQLSDGTMDPACHRGFPTPWVAFTYLARLEALFPKSKLFGEYHQGYKDINTIHEVDCISGAFFLVRREVIETVGMLDEDFFMYGEDIDWAYRIRGAGWKILFNPKVTILHKKKQSGRANTDRARRIRSEVYFHRYNWLFYTKHFAHKYPLLMTWGVNTIYTMRIFMLERFGI